MKKNLFSIVLFFMFAISSAQAGILIAANSAGGPVVGLSNHGAYVGAGVSIGGVSIYYGHSHWSLVGLAVILTLDEDSLDNYELFVETRYPFIQNADAKSILAQEIRDKKKQSLINENGFVEVILTEDFINVFSEALNLSIIEKDRLIQDLL